MEVRIKINCDSSAFDDFPGLELARILNRLAKDLDEELENGTFIIFDINGNSCGTAQIIE